MKKLLLATIAALSLTSAASATTYSVDVTATPFRVPGADGLQTRAVVLSPSGPQNFNGATYNVTLNNIGDSVTMAVFGLVAYDSPINADDLNMGSSTATFTIGALTETVLGHSFAVPSAPVPTTLGYALADYLSSVVIRVAPALGIRISLADTVFATDGNGNFVDGRAGIGLVNATFSLAAIPVPAGLPLALTGLGLLGFVARRKKAQKITA